MSKQIKANALVCKADGQWEDLPNTNLETLQQAVNGYVELVRLAEDLEMYVNEEGLMFGLPYNPMASMLAGQKIVGNAVFVVKK